MCALNYGPVLIINWSCCLVHNEKALACICWQFFLTIMTVFGLAVQMVYVSLLMAQTGSSNSLCHLFQPISEPLDFKALFPLIWRLTADFPMGMWWIRSNTALTGTHFGTDYIWRYRCYMTLSLYSEIIGLYCFIKGCSQSWSKN